jgi:cytochrome d ubiquinol oxidase subunit II
MATLWFLIVLLMVAAYVVLDGFDLGAGVIYLGAAKTPVERRNIMRAIGPVWDGNEVWLIAAGGTLYFAFPRLSTPPASAASTCRSSSCSGC